MRLRNSLEHTIERHYVNTLEHTLWTQEVDTHTHTLRDRDHFALWVSYRWP